MKMFVLAASLAVVCGVGGNAVAATLVMPPAVPQPSKKGDLVGFIVQNPGTTPALAQWLTFGQVFPVGVLAPTAFLSARDSDATRSVQMDVLATHPDGSVRFAAITTVVPQIVAGGSLSGMLALHATAPSGSPVDLAARAPQLTVALTVTSSPIGAFTKTIDLGAALQTSLASGKPDYWLHGPLATQARVDVPVGASFHITADITGYYGGRIIADVQFNNDLAMGTVGGTFSYNATITLDGKTQKFTNVVQNQYQDWHSRFAINGLPTDNVQHDAAYLERTGAILPYDLTTGVAATTLQGYTTLAQSAGFGAPLAVNGVSTSMPNTGARPDIGYTTQYDTVWLVTQDVRAATIGLAQGDTGGAVPWNMKLANGHWLTPYDYPNIWTDPRGGGGGTTGLTQQTTNTVWTLDPSHAPNLAYVPYLMAASRWYLDRLNAQAAWVLSFDWGGYRCPPYGSNCQGLNDIVVNGGDEIRGQGWSIREIEEAAFVGKAGSFEQSYNAKVAKDNWTYINGQQTGNGFMSAAVEGQAAGWLPGSDPPGTPYFQMSPWMEDYVTGIAALAAEMGDAGALQYVNWQKDTWLAGRFNVPSSQAMNPYDGVAYRLITTNASAAVLTAWSAIESATVSQGFSEGSTWNNVDGNYAQLARGALGAALTLFPTDANLQNALAWVNSKSSVPNAYLSQYWFQQDPTWNVVPLR